MTKQNRSIWIDVICVFLILNSLFFIFGTSFQKILLLFNPVFKEYAISYYGEDIYRLTVWSDPIWIFFHLIYMIGSTLALKRKAMGQKIITVMSVIGMALYILTVIIEFHLGNFYYKYRVVVSLPYVHFYFLILLTIIIYIFTQPRIKEEFK